MNWKAIVAAAAGVLAALSLQLAAQTTGETAHLDWNALGQFELESVGQSTVKAWYDTLAPGRADNTAPWKQLIWFKKDSRTVQKSYFASVDFETGTLTELPTMVPSMQPWGRLWVNGKFYIGFNLLPRLSIYDPATDALTDLGPCFSSNSLTLYSMAVAPDGVIAMGGGTGSDVSLYDPVTSGFTHFGQVATLPGGGTYAYYLSVDSNYVYVAVRSSDPWQLVRLDRTTKERTVLLTSASVYDFLSINGNAVELSHPADPKQYFYLQNGQLIACTATNRPPNWVLPGPGFSGTAPGIAIDQSPVLNGSNALAVYIQDPANTTAWRQAALPLRPDAAGITLICALDDGRLAGMPNAYFATVLVNPTNGATQRIPLDNVSAYGLLAVSNRVFIGGYPSARVLAFDTTRPMTWEDSIPGRPGVPEANAAANPCLIKVLSSYTDGAHIARHLCRGADGNVFLAAWRERYYYGFALAWFNPEPGTNGAYAFTVFDDQGAFNHLQVHAMQAINGGSNLLISTEVQYNKNVPGEAPDAASVFLFDVAQKRIVGRYEPLTNCQEIAGVAMDGPDILVGYANDYKAPGVSTLFRFNIGNGNREGLRHYDKAMGNLCLQPDGLIWGGILYGHNKVLFTVNPRDLSVLGLGKTPEAGPAYFCHPSGVYLGGCPQLMRVAGLSPPAAPPPLALAFTTLPSPNTVAGAPFGRQPVVAIQYADGSTVTTGADSRLDVTLALTGGSGILSGTTNVTAVAGVASFSGLSIDLIGADKVLTASAVPTLAPGVMPASTAPFTINRGIGQTIAFPAIPDQVVTNRVHLSATASSGLAVTNFTVAAGPGTIVDQTNLTFHAAGMVSIVAGQAGDTNWSEAPDVANTFAVYAWSPRYSTIPWADNFELYAARQPLANGYNGWFGSSTTILAQPVVVASGAQAAGIPACCILSNRFQTAAGPPRVWIQMDLRPVLCDGTNSPMAVDPDATVMFYVNSNGQFVVHDGPASPNSWVTLTNYSVGTTGTNWVTIRVYKDYGARTWDLYADSKLLTNHIGFINPGRASFGGFDVCSGFAGTRTSFLDNVSVSSANNMSAGSLILLK
jgi:hypothetical protein